MLNPKRYIQVLFVILFLLGGLAVGYVYYFVKYYPPPITNRISFDAKLKFIRDHIDPDKIDTLIVGSSIGLNDVLGSVLEEKSTKVHYALNMSVYEATTLEVEQILELSDAFPNLQRIIYSAQYSDFPHTWKYKDYKPKVLMHYIRHELSPLGLFRVLFNACNNLLFCKERADKWENEHMKSDQFTYLGFDDTGSVPLKIYRKEKVGGRWYLPHPGIMHAESFSAVERMVQKAQKRGVRFYLVHQPYRNPLVEKHESVRSALKYFDDRISTIMEKYENGELIRLQHLQLNDSYFADRTHLNEKGSRLISEKIAKIIDHVEKNKGKECSLLEQK